MRARTVFFGFIMFIITVYPSMGQNTVKIPEPEQILATLDRSHPRLILKKDDLARLKNYQESDATFQKYARDVIKRADEDYQKAPLTYKLSGPRQLMLGLSRDLMQRVYSLGMAWHLTGDEKYAKKLEENLLSVCAFKDWHPSHFLDTAELSHGVGIGYDWLYNVLSEASRKKIREGLIENGLKPGIDAYIDDPDTPQLNKWWVTCDHNWNQVCNFSLIIGALAIAETHPEYSLAIIPRAVKVLPIALVNYGPDGAWTEGPGYWSYATHYTTYGLSAMESALGTSFGLADIQGISMTGLFPVFTTGPTNLFLNFADSGEKSSRWTAPCLFWLSRRYGNQFMANQEHEVAESRGAGPQHLMWYVQPTEKKSAAPELDRLFHGPVDVAVFRSGWNDPGALFVGVKAGYNEVNHAHLDLGNFELDALGVRWARDLGSDDYSMPGYFDAEKGGDRWQYYRLLSRSHNVPLLNDQDQDVLGKSKVVKFDTNVSTGYAIIDLTTAYAPLAKKTTRGIAIIQDRRAVLVQDEFELSGSCEVAWGMTTDADITIDGDSALLKLEGRELTARILEPSGARFTVESAHQEPPENPNKGISRLMIRMKNQQGDARVAVLLSPHWQDGTRVETTQVKPLTEW